MEKHKTHPNTFPRDETSTQESYDPAVHSEPLALGKNTNTLPTLVVGSLNVCGCSTIESKRCDIGCMFGRRGMDVSALCEI